MRAAILLAAGSSRRFGRGDKLLAKLRGRPLLDHVLDNVLRAPVRRVLVVIPSRGGRVARLVKRRGDRRLAMVVARRHARGVGASLRAALARVRPVERELLIFLGDMPAARIPRRLCLSPGHVAARPVSGSVPGHPMLVRSAAARAARIGEDDRGLAGRLDPRRIASLPAGGAAKLDIDSQAALRRARYRWGGRQCWPI